MGPGLAIASVAAPIIGGVIGQMASAGDRAAAEKAMQEAQAIIDSVGAPPDLSRQIILDKFEQAGVLTPQLEQAVSIGTSKVSEMQVDPATRQAQMEALQTMQQMGRTGLGAEDRAALAQIRDQVQRDAEAKRQQIVQQMQARGQGGAGAELAASLAASQEGSQRASEEGLRVGAQAQARALQALAQAGTLGGNIRGQDIGLENLKSSAADEFQKFDVQNAINRQQRNVGSQNQAQQFNIGRQQQVSDANIAAANAEKARQQEARRQYWQDQLNYAQARAGARTGAQNFYTNRAANTASSWAGMGTAAGQGLGAAGQYSSKSGGSSEDPSQNFEKYGMGGRNY
jgi:hypothetical protein